MFRMVLILSQVFSASREINPIPKQHFDFPEKVLNGPFESSKINRLHELWLIKNR